MIVNITIFFYVVANSYNHYFVYVDWQWFHLMAQFVCNAQTFLQEAIDIILSLSFSRLSFHHSPALLFYQDCPLLHFVTGFFPFLNKSQSANYAFIPQFYIIHYNTVHAHQAIFPNGSAMYYCAMADMCIFL